MSENRDNDNSPIFIPGTSRVDLARLFARMGYTRGIEIGTGGGVYSEVLCQTIPGLRLVCVDLWRPYDGYLDFTSVEHLEQDYAQAKARLAPYCVELWRKDSMDASTIFPNGGFDFIYIDANHQHPWVDNDIRWWERKVRPGGIVSGHDYATNHRDVCEAVQEFTRAHGIRPYFAVGRPAEIDHADTIPSWFYFKP